MKTDAPGSNSAFLTGGGEMGQLIRSKDWSKTLIGSPDKWPQSLLTTLNILLNSKFPMFLWWGSDLVQFYNDAYRPSLGNNGKHPSALGQNAIDCWPEIWPVIKPLIDQVLQTGEATWSENQLIPIFRNEHIEDVYWTFSYSAVKDENGNIAGVLVVCNETSGQVLAQKKLEDSEARTRLAVDAAALGTFDLDILTYKIITSERFCEIFGFDNADVLYNDIIKAIHPDDIYIREDANRQAMAKGYVDYEVRIVRPDKSIRWVNILGKLFLNEHKDPVRLLGTVMDITDSITSKHLLEDSEERLRLATDITGLATWDLDLQTNKIIHTPRCAEIFGHDISVILSHQTLLNQIHPDDLQTILKPAFEEAVQTGIYKYEARVLKPDHSISWIRAIGKMLYDKEKRPIKLVGTLKDITDEKKHQQELIESEKTFRLLADSMPQFIWTGDAEGNLNYYNQSVFNYSGLTFEQIKKEGWLQIVHPDDREENIKIWMEAITSGKDFLFEHRFRRYDGIYRWQLSRARPQNDAAGNIQMWVGTSTDIEDQKMFTTGLEKQVLDQNVQIKNTSQELIKSEERYHLMVGEVQDYAILFLNSNGIIENWNKGAEKIKGYSANEIIGKSFSVFYTEEDRLNHLPETLLNRAKQTGKALQEGWRVRKDGTLFWASVVITALHNEQGDVIGFTKVTRDLTEKKKTDEKIAIHAAQLEEKNQELEKINAELKLFAYVSSHDLQEPLRKIQTFSSSILEKENQNLSEKGKDYFNRIQQSADRMQTLIEDLLAYSRASIAERVFINTDLGSIVNEIKADFKEILTKKQAVIDSAEMCTISIIPFQFRQLMHNLVSNSLKFSKDNVPPCIQIRSEAVRGDKLNIATLSPKKMYCHLSVSDNGIGFDPVYKERIFEVFQRLHGREQYKGTGIGLAIVKKIVENHNGIVTATSELNKGATFDIYIPIK